MRCLHVSNKYFSDSASIGSSDQITRSICITSCAAEWFATISLSFETGIADSIASFKCRKMFLFIRNIYFSQIEKRTNGAVTMKYFIPFSGIFYLVSISSSLVKSLDK